MVDIPRENMYCENATCRVLVYETKATVRPDEKPNENCPGCGQFGRKKGK
jgi:hypothetical protein